MRRFLSLAGLAALALSCPTEAQEGGKGIDLDGMSSPTPARWVKVAPTTRMRYAQFRLPKVGDDKDDADLVIFKGLGGSAKANIDRWKQEFQPPKGKTMDDVSKVTEIKIGGHQATRLDISEGTFLYNPAPFDPKSKKVAKPGYRMIGIQFEGPKDVYHIKLTGPAKTVEANKKAFEEWLKGFKK